ncbi:MAG: hypothetical protein LKK00_10150 [Intestinimonas sp.]|jgi:hypothetical protein|nr:hypothetical protein [Intestinimonas sp.]
MTKLEIARVLLKEGFKGTGLKDYYLSFYVGVLSGALPPIVSTEDGMYSPLILDEAGSCGNLECVDFFMDFRDAQRLFELFDRQMSYLEQSGFDMTEWKIREIPIPSSFIYENSVTGQRFELDSFPDDKQLYPCYMPNLTQIRKAESIEDAIQKYVGNQQELSETLSMITNGKTSCISGKTGLGKRAQEPCKGAKQ